MLGDVLLIDFIPAILYLINLLSDQPNKKYLTGINNLCFLCLIATFLLIGLCRDVLDVGYCACSMILLSTMFFMGHLKQMRINYEEKQKQL